MANNRYTTQRKRVTPPHISLAAARKIAGLTLEQMASRIEEVSGVSVSIGALSGIENGHRGASEQLIDALALAFDVQPEQIATEYQPKRWRKEMAA